MGYNILVVDDSLAMRKVIKKALKISGLQGEVLEAGNGFEGVEIVTKNWVDIVFTDIHMPDMDGIEFIKRLKTIPTCAEIPIVVISTEGRESIMEQIKQMGVAGYLTKPFKPNEVRELVLSIMEVDSDVDADDEECDF